MSDITNVQVEPERPAKVASRSPLGIIIASIVVILLILLALWAIPVLFGGRGEINGNNPTRTDTRTTPAGTQ